MNSSKPWKMALGTALVALQILAFAGGAAALPIADPDPNDPSGGQPPTPPKYNKPAEGFDWTAKQRYGMWPGAWRSREQFASWKSETYNPAYVMPSIWKLTMMGCQTENDFLYSYLDPKVYKENYQDGDPVKYPGNNFLYRWKWNGTSSSFTPECYGDLSFPAEGNYYVTLEVKDPKTGTIQTWTNPVQVKDYLIVVLGDSSASGEGAPDTFVNNSPSGRAEWVDNRCHRSTHAGGALTAARLESLDPKTSVTFLSFACSGATLATEIYDGGLPDPYENETDHEFRGVGITGPYAGVEPVRIGDDDTPDFSQKLPGQVDQLWNALTNFGTRRPREIDALIVAGGINDSRFADLATVCVLFQGCPFEDVGETNFPPRPGDVQRELDEQFQFDVARVPHGWDVLAEQLNQSRNLQNGLGTAAITAHTKLALQYPPFFHDEDGERCSRLLWDSLPLWIYALYPFAGWDYDEIGFADQFWATDLDREVRKGSERNGFTYVDTIANSFFLHGICAEDNWINSPTEAAELQGDDVGEAGAFASLFSKGSAHPNRAGYWAYSEEILRHLGHLTKKEGNNPPVARKDTVIAAKGLPSNFNVLANDFDDDVADVLSVRVVTPPAHGTVTMQKDGTTTYKANAYLGDDSFLYELTDGTDVRFGLVAVTVVEPYKVEFPVIGGQVTQVGGLTGDGTLAPPYSIVFDKPLRERLGTVRFDPTDGLLYYDAPPLRRKRIKMRYTVYSDTDDVTSPGYGTSMRGVLILRVRTPR